MQLRNCQANVSLTDITLELLTGEIVTLKNALVLTSYKSRVAVYHDDTLYLLPRYGYSATTWQHLHSFRKIFARVFAYMLVLFAKQKNITMEWVTVSKWHGVSLLEATFIHTNY